PRAGSAWSAGWGWGVVGDAPADSRLRKPPRPVSRWPRSFLAFSPGAGSPGDGGERGRCGSAAVAGEDEGRPQLHRAPRRLRLLVVGRAHGGAPPPVLGIPAPLPPHPRDAPRAPGQRLLRVTRLPAPRPPP